MRGRDHHHRRRWTSQILEAQEQPEHRIEQLELNISRSPRGADAIDFQPQYVEVKGFCSWNDRLSKGATRGDAEELMQELLPLLPLQLQQHDRPLQLRGLRNYSVQIPVASDVMREVKGISSENLRAAELLDRTNANYMSHCRKLKSSVPGTRAWASCSSLCKRQNLT